MASTCYLVVLQQIKNILSEKLTGNRRLKLSTIDIFSANLITLYCDCKPGFLYDLPEKITFNTALSIAEELRTLYASFSDITVFEYNMDIIFIRHRLLASHLGAHKYPCIININHDQPQLDMTGELCAKEKAVLLDLCSRLDSDPKLTSQVVQVTDNEELSGPSMFGLLLGFPVIYYLTKKHHCLDYKPLEVFKLSIRGVATETDKLFIVSSFSVPRQILNGYLSQSVNDWKDLITQRVSRFKLPFSLTSVSKTHSTLTL